MTYGPVSVNAAVRRLIKAPESCSSLRYFRQHGLQCPQTSVLGQPKFLTHDLVDSYTCKASGKGILGRFLDEANYDVYPSDAPVRIEG